MPGGFNPPYMRMHLRTKRPNQHQLLLDLEAEGKKVFYATPDFWTFQKLDEHFSNGRVHERSWYIEPSAIGPLNSLPHCLAYQLRNPSAWLCSEPKKLEGQYGSEHFADEINQAVLAAAPQESQRFLNELARTIARLTKAEVPALSQRGDQPRQEERENATKKETGISPDDREDIRSRRLIVAAREVAYMSQVRLGCMLIITGRDS